MLFWHIESFSRRVRRMTTSADQAVALQMASRSGDMRRLLDACTAAVDLLVQDAAEQQTEQDIGMLFLVGQSTGRAECIEVVLQVAHYYQPDKMECFR